MGKYIAVFWGHGGSDSGAIYKDRKEKTYNLAVALEVKAQLEAKGHKVLMDRTTDKSSSISARARLANEKNVDAAIEIHHNAGGGQGSEVYFYNFSVNGKKLAAAIQDKLSALGFKNRGIKPDSTSRFGQFGIIRQTKAPCVLVECCFLDSDNDMAKASAAAKARAITDGIATIYGQAKPKEIQVGDIVTFNGGYHYRSADALSPTGSKRSAGKAKVTAISKGAKYPYHLIGEKNGSNVYGWVASKDISQ